MNAPPLTPPPLVIATRNPRKLHEMKRLLGALPSETRDASAFPEVPDPAEGFESYLENARRKAVHFATHTRHFALADDSGLEIDALGGKPGPRSARFAGPHATDRENIRRVLEALLQTPRSERTARYRCVLVLASANGQVLATAEGVCEGLILQEEAPGAHGFGYDPIFYVPEYGKTFAEVPPHLKDRLSHRGLAVRAILPALDSLRASLP